MKIKNLTPHTITIYGQRGLDDDPLVEIPPEPGPRAECSALHRRYADDSGEFAMAGENREIMLMTTEFGAISGLPEQEENVILVTSGLVAQAAAKAGRTDVFFPCILLRDARGWIVGCRFLSRYPTITEK